MLAIFLVGFVFLWLVLWTYNSHAFSEDVDEALVVDGAGTGEEEVGDGEVEEGDGGDDGFGGYESHGCDRAMVLFIAGC